MFRFPSSFCCYASRYIYRDRHDHPILRNHARQCHTQGTVMCHAPSRDRATSRLLYVAT